MKKIEPSNEYEDHLKHLIAEQEAYIKEEPETIDGRVNTLRKSREWMVYAWREALRLYRTYAGIEPTIEEQFKEAGMQLHPPGVLRREEE